MHRGDTGEEVGSTVDMGARGVHIAFQKSASRGHAQAPTDPGLDPRALCGAPCKFLPLGPCSDTAGFLPLLPALSQGGN